MVPILPRTVEETQQELQELELERSQREESYQSESRSLVQRFRQLGEDVKVSLKELSRRYLEALLPTSSKREQMLQDPTFQKLANRTVTERFFAALDQGLSSALALERTRLACCGG